MIKLCCFDIETAPLPETDIANLAPKFEAPSNYKDAEKIAANIAEQKAAWLQRSALSPLTGTVAAIGTVTYLSGRSDCAYEIQLAADGETEANLINFFWNTFRLHVEHTQFIGFNIFRFDLPFLIRRSYKLGIRVPLGVREGRYFNRNFTDLMDEWQCGNREERISLDTLAKYLGVGAKTGSGADFYKLPPQQQREYLTNDLQLTKLCADKVLQTETPKAPVPSSAT